MTAKTNLSAERLRELLNYDPLSGNLTWKIRTSNRIKVGDIAGALLLTGYLSISIDGKLHRAHRLVWLWVYGVWPDAELDHINGVRTDNRIANLRDVTSSMNQQNLRSARGGTHSGLLGVHKTDKVNKKWRASIKVDGKEKHIGIFFTKEAAQIAYLDVKRKLHVGCTI